MNIKLDKNNLQKLINPFLGCGIFILPFIVLGENIKKSLDAGFLKQIAALGMIIENPALYYILIGLFGISLFAVLLKICSKITNRDRGGVGASKFCIHADEVVDTFDSCLNYIPSPNTMRISLVPGFRSGNIFKRVIAVIYYLASLSIILEKDYLLMAVMISGPFVVFGIQGLISKKHRRYDKGIKIVTLVAFTVFFAAAAFFIYLSILMGQFNIYSGSNLVCRIPDILTGVGIKTDRVKIYNVAIAIGQQNQTPFLKKGNYLDSMGDKAGAEECYRLASRTANAGHEPFYRLGVIYMKKGESGKALEMLRSAQDSKADFLPAYYEAIRLLERNGDQNAAVHMINRLIGTGKADGDAYILIGQFWTGQRNYSEGLKAYDKALGFKENFSEALVGKAFSLLMLERAGEALYSIERAQKINPNDSYISYVKGAVLSKLNRYTEAAGSLKSVQPGDVYYADALGELAWCSLMGGNLKKAKSEIDNALKYGDKNARIQFIYSHVLSAHDEHSAALGAIDRAIDLDSNTAAFYARKADIFLKTENTEAIVEELEKAFKINKNDPYTNLVRGRYLLNKKLYQDALKVFEETLQFDPYLSRAYAWAGVAAQMLGKSEKASDYIYISLSLNNKDYINYFAKSIVLSKRGDNMGAKSAMDKAVHLKGNNIGLEPY